MQDAEQPDRILQHCSFLVADRLDAHSNNTKQRLEL
jgi:hypothetical protein